MTRQRTLSRWMRFLLGVAFASTATAVSASPDIAPGVRDGDLVFHTSKSAQSLAIQKATGSSYSHMGMIFYRDGQPYVFEAASAVRFTPLDEWVARGEERRYVVKRLRNARTMLGSTGLAKLRAAALEFVGRPYDLAF